MHDAKTISNQIKQLLDGKKARMTVYVIGVLWIAVIMQVAVNTFFKPNSNLLEAFVSTNSNVSSFELEMAADYGAQYLSDEDKQELILYMAKEIGLEIDQEVTINRKDRNCEVYIQKKNKNAETLIKLVSVEQKTATGVNELNHYLLVRLKIFKNMDSILSYRELLKDIFEKLETTNLQTTMQLAGNYKGKLTLSDKNLIADSMIHNLQGKVAYANRQDELYTIYAYSGLLEEHVTSLDTKINIHVAINYDEVTDSTNVYLGTPVINGGY